MLRLLECERTPVNLTPSLYTPDYNGVSRLSPGIKIVGHGHAYHSGVCPKEKVAGGNEHPVLNAYHPSEHSRKAGHPP